MLLWLPGMSNQDRRSLLTVTRTDRTPGLFWRVKAEYYLDHAGTTAPIATGDVVVAPLGCVHGVVNHGDEPLIFTSVVTPAEAGYQLVTLDSTAPKIALVKIAFLG